MRAYLKLLAYSAPILLVLCWLAFRHDISWKIPKLCAYGLLGLGLGIYGVLKQRGVM
jgi:hypothetical protein